MEIFQLPCEKQYDNKLSDYRAINRYVWYQIRQMIKNDVQLGRIIKIDADGNLSVNMNSRLLTAEQKDTILRLLENQRSGIYRIHKFKDLDERLDDKEEYNKWFDEKAMNSFMHTIPTKQVFYTYPYELLREIRETHSSTELNREDFNGYSIWQTMFALDMINPFLVGTILGKEIDVEDHSWAYIKFNYNGKTIYGRENSIDLFEKDENGEFVKLEDTIHTLLFRHYQEPIFATLYSMMYPIGGDRVMPREGLDYYPSIPELERETSEILQSENYKTLSKKYRLRFSKVSLRDY